jgi:hypothetical protein
VLALDVMLQFPAAAGGPSLDAVLRAAEGHVLSAAQLVAPFARPAQ